MIVNLLYKSARETILPHDPTRPAPNDTYSVFQGEGGDRPACNQQWEHILGGIKLLGKQQAGDNHFVIYIVAPPKGGKTNLWYMLIHSHKTKKKPDKPQFYYRCFDKIYLFSSSMDTIDNKKLKIHSTRRFPKYTGEKLMEILDEEKVDENNNILLIMDNNYILYLMNLQQ